MKTKHQSPVVNLPVPALTEEIDEHGGHPPHDEAGWDKVRKLAVRRMDRMMNLEPKVLRGDDPEAIHNFRVASRRVQQALDLLFPASRPAEIRRLRRRIRRCRKLFSDVRNCDVLIERVRRQLGVKRSTQREASESFFAYLSERRQKAHSRALRKLSRLNLAEVYVRLGTAFREELQLNKNEDSPDNMHLRGVRQRPLRKRLAEEMNNIWQEFAARCDQSQSAGSGEALHATRIAAKRLRYLGEMIDKLNAEGSREALTWLRVLQDILGDWHDLEIAEQMMTEMIAKPQFLRENPDIATGVLKLISRNKKAKDRLQSKYRGISLDSPGGQALKVWAERVIAVGEHLT
ncbi:MAG TPA: CHAD domain-containing protein [Terriglobia bacterium]|nr:CHAD domain-containing protein [Terriglobia bacterium]